MHAPLNIIESISLKVLRMSPLIACPVVKMSSKIQIKIDQCTSNWMSLMTPSLTPDLRYTKSLEKIPILSIEEPSIISTSLSSIIKEVRRIGA
jgi:hypothetical protein